MKKICLLCLLLVSCFCSTVWAYPPFAGGPITGAYGEWRPDTGSQPHYHAGIDVGGDGYTIYAPWDGYVEHRDTTNDNLGAASVLIIGANGEGGFFFGDLGPDTLQMKDGYVTAGTPIGVVQGTNADSTGAHIHVEYRKPNNTGFFSTIEGTEDPVPILLSLGVALTGDLTGSGGSKPMDEVSLPWGVKGMYEVGKDMSEVMKKFSLAGNKAATYLGKLVYPSLILLCLLDLIIPILLRGMVTNKRELIPKIFKYTGAIALVALWTSFTDDILLSFLTSTTSTFTSGDPVVTENLSNPQLMFQHVIAVLEPGLNKISTFTAMEWLRNFGYILVIYLASFLAMGAWLIACIYVVISYVEFYVSAGLSVVSVPFGVNRFTRFASEGAVGHLLTSMFRLLFIAIVIGISVNLVKDARPDDIFKIGLKPATETTTPATGVDGNAYTGDIAVMAQKYGIDPYIAIAIAMRETGGDTVEGIHMAVATPDNPSSGIFQILPGQDVAGPDGTRISIEERFPNYQTDPAQNIEAGMMMLRDKINMMDGDVWAGVEAYNGGGDSGYLAQVQANYAKISGKPISSIGHTFITGEMVSKYLILCLCLTALAIILILVPRSIAQKLGGPIVVPQEA